MRLLTVAILLFVGFTIFSEVTAKESRENYAKTISKNGGSKKGREMGKDVVEESRHEKKKKQRNVSAEEPKYASGKKRETISEDEMLSGKEKKWQKNKSKSKRNENVDYRRNTKDSRYGEKSPMKKVYMESRGKTCERNCEDSAHCASAQKWAVDKNKRSIKMREIDPPMEEDLIDDNVDEENGEDDNGNDADICPKCRVYEDEIETDAEAEENL